MARPITEQSKLPSASMPWARQVSDTLNNLTNKVSNFIADQTNKNRANNANIQNLSNQNNLLAQQNERLNAQVSYLASLTTVSTVGSDYSSGDIPGDQTQRWTSAGNSTVVTTRVATGRMLVVLGCGQITINAGNSSAIAYIRVTATAPSGWTTTFGANTRVFASHDMYFGVPVSSERTVDGVPTDETITLTLEFGTWSAASSPLSNAQFSSPFLRCEVVPA